MSFAFLTASATDAVARSPMERQARAAGARFEVRDGWNVAVGYPRETAAPEAFAFADASHLRKYEKQGDLPALEFGKATVSSAAASLAP
jgi:glycine cleavage system aminomethyltransferase T